MDMDIEKRPGEMSGVETGSKTLPCDIFWTLAHTFLQNPVDVFNLARTCHGNWELLETEIFRTDVVFYKTILGSSREEPGNVTMADDSASGDTTPEGSVHEDSAFEDSDEDLEDTMDSGDYDGRAYVPPKKRERNFLHCLADPKWRPPTILQWAASSGHEEVAETSIIVAGRVWPEYVFLEHPDSLNSALHFAAWYGNLGVLRLLSQVRINDRLLNMNTLAGVTFNAESNAKSYSNRTDHGLCDVFQGINPSIGYFPKGPFTVSDRRDTFGINAAGLAILRGHTSAAEYLIDNFYGNDITEYGEPRTATGLRTPVDPLHLACFMGMENIVATILEKGADVNSHAHQMEDSTPLMLAVARPNNDRIINCLLSHGADVNIQNIWRRDALVWAILFQSHENALRVVKAGARVDFRFRRLRGYLNDEYTQILCVEDDAFLPCTKLILQRYPDLPAELLRACVNHAFKNLKKNQATVRWLVDQGLGLGPLERTDYPFRGLMAYPGVVEVGFSALHHIAGSEALPLELLSMALDKRPEDINVIAGETRHTPLSLAFKFGYDSETVALLLAHGADPAATKSYHKRNPRTMINDQPKVSE
ncbi:hypothetical protein PG997_001978 [Apiospora hydei]|uniref:Ankyrin n=1 Tax=Apiospora hydei TaxID=1337664 RepID=A0ABR1X836_9PEZI